MIFEKRVKHIEKESDLDENQGVQCISLETCSYGKLRPCQEFPLESHPRKIPLTILSGKVSPNVILSSQTEINTKKNNKKRG